MTEFWISLRLFYARYLSRDTFSLLGFSFAVVRPAAAHEHDSR